MEADMKSPMVINNSFIQDKEEYSDMTVLRSNAGFYIGTRYSDGSPGTRDSGYFKTRDQAETKLKDIEQKGWDYACSVLRSNP
jgi:hypothetical protein